MSEFIDIKDRWELFVDGFIGLSAERSRFAVTRRGKMISPPGVYTKNASMVQFCEWHEPLPRKGCYA